jgi:hypothetical protein
MDTLTREILKREMQAYAKKGFNGYGILMANDAEDYWAVVYFSDFRGQHIVDAGIAVRLQDELIIIEHDANDKILLDALLQAGIPREKIILAYAGEPAPEPIISH